MRTKAIMKARSLGLIAHLRARAKALEQYEIQMNRCLTYAAETPHAQDVPDDVRKIEKRSIQRPTSNSFIECTTCIDACPIGTPLRTKRIRAR